MNADVDPFPLVPAICIALSALRSEGYQIQVSRMKGRVRLAVDSIAAYLVPDSSQPLDHLGNSLLVHLSPRLPYCINNGKITLQRVQRRYSVLETSQSTSTSGTFGGCFTYCVCPGHGCGRRHKRATSRAKICRYPPGPFPHHKANMLAETGRTS